MKYRQSLVSFALKHGASRTSRKYNKSRSYIYFWLSRYSGTIESLVCQSRRPNFHPNQHTEVELDLLHHMRRRNPDLGLCELWCRMRARGCSIPASVFKSTSNTFLLPVWLVKLKVNVSTSILLSMNSRGFVM